jgi:hypothetical protein
MTGTRVEAWQVHDSGLVAVPTRFRRLGGLVRHLQGQGERWPDRVVLELVEGELRVTSPDGDVGTWSTDAVTAERVSDGPPVHFVLDTPVGSHLLAAAIGADVDALLDALR